MPKLSPQHALPRPLRWPRAMIYNLCDCGYLLKHRHVSLCAYTRVMGTATNDFCTFYRIRSHFPGHLAFPRPSRSSADWVSTSIMVVNLQLNTGNLSPISIRTREFGIARQIRPSWPASAHSFSTPRLNLMLTRGFLSFLPLSVTASIYTQSTAIGSVPSLSGHATAYR